MGCPEDRKIKYIIKPKDIKNIQKAAKAMKDFNEAYNSLPEGAKAFLKDARNEDR